MIIEIKGVQFVNKGAELMLHAVLAEIQQHWPQAKIALEPNPYSPYEQRARLGAYQKLSVRKNIIDLNALTYKLPKRLRIWLQKKWGLVTEADIGLVLDASGFAYGDQWGAMKIRHLAGELKRYHKAGTPYVFLPQALGPFTRPKDRAYLQKTLPLASLICAREADSYAYVKEVVGELEQLKQFPDFTNLVQGEVPHYFVNGDNKVLIIPNSNMIGERNNHQPEWKQNYIRVLCEAVEVIRELGFEPVLLNHEGQGDGAVCEEVMRNSGGYLEYIEELHPLRVKGIIGAVQAVICSRFHGCVSALAQGTPCLGTSWSHKYECLFDEYHRNEYLLNPEVTQVELNKLLTNAIKYKEEPVYLAAIEAFKQQARSLWALVAERV